MIILLKEESSASRLPWYKDDFFVLQNHWTLETKWKKKEQTKKFIFFFEQSKSYFLYFLSYITLWSKPCDLWTSVSFVSTMRDTLLTGVSLFLVSSPQWNSSEWPFFDTLHLPRLIWVKVLLWHEPNKDSWGQATLEVCTWTFSYKTPVKLTCCRVEKMRQLRIILLRLLPDPTSSSPLY